MGVRDLNIKCFLTPLCTALSRVRAKSQKFLAIHFNNLDNYYGLLDVPLKDSAYGGNFSLHNNTNTFKYFLVNFTGDRKEAREASVGS